MGCSHSQPNTVKIPEKPTEVPKPVSQRDKKFPTPLSHPNNPHNDHFRVVIEDRARIIFAKQHDGKYYTWIKNGEIPQGQTTSFIIRQRKTSVGANLFTGIATGAIFGTGYTKQEITYSSRDGSVVQSGRRSNKGGVGVEDGKEIQVVVDLVRWQVIFYVHYQQQARFVIPYTMQNKQLFLVIMMQMKDDFVELLFQ